MYPTIIVSIIIFGILALIIANMIKKKKSGKSGCGCGCSSCGMESACKKPH